MFRADFKVVILDESHYVKNPSAARTENVVDIVKKAQRRILLTGTPALARPSELFSQIDSILPGRCLVCRFDGAFWPSRRKKGIQ